jgi:hypothetical protein
MLNSQRTLFWMPLAMAAALLVAGGLLNYQTWERATAELKINRAELEGLRDSNEGIKRVIQSAPDFPKIQSKFYAEVPRDPNLGLLLESISGKLAELKIGGEEVVTEPTKAGPRYSREPVTLRFRANGDQTHKMLSHLRDCERLTRIDRLKVEQAQDGGAPVVEIQFSAFSRPMEEATAWLEPR